MTSMASYLPITASFLPYLLVAYAFFESALKPRGGAWLRAAQLALFLAILLMPPTVPWHWAQFLLIATIVITGYQDTPSRKVLASSLLLVGHLFGEVVAVFFWLFLTGGAATASVKTSMAMYGSHLLSCLIGACFSLFATRMLAQQLKHLDEHLRRNEFWLSGAVVMQSSTFLFLRSTYFDSSPQSTTLLWFSMLGYALCVIADSLALRSFGLLRKREEDRLRLERVQQSIAGLETHCAEELAALGECAMLRHDLRNHEQVIAVLINQGRLEEASAYARGLVDEWSPEDKKK